MKRNGYKRAIGVIALVAALIGSGFAIPGVVEFVQANALWGNRPEAGSWLFAQSQWWFGIAFVGLLVWLATCAILRDPARRD